MFRLIMIFLFFGILSLPATAFQVEVLDTKISATAKTTGNEVRQQWTIAKKDNLTIKTIRIELRNSPVDIDRSKIKLSCIYDGKNGCHYIMVDAEEIADSKPLSVSLRTPFVGHYVLRVHTKFAKIVQKPNTVAEAVANSNNPTTSSDVHPNEVYDVYDVVIERDPAAAAYSIGQLPNLSITEGNIIYGDNAAIRPVFRITANGSVGTAKLTSILTAIPMEQDGKLPSPIGDTVLTCWVKNSKDPIQSNKAPQEDQTNCVKMPIGTVTAAKPANFAVKLTNFPGAGKYKINLEVTDPLSKPISSSFELTVREHWSMAFLLILSGVFAAFMIKQVAGKSLPALRRRQLVATAGRRLSRYFVSIADPDQVTLLFVGWINTKLLDASDDLGPEKLDDEKVIILSQLPDLFLSWFNTYDKASKIQKDLLSIAATNLTGSILTQAGVDNLKAKIKSISDALKSARSRESDEASRQGIPIPNVWSRSLSRIDRMITTREFTINMFVFLIATISGVTALWTGNAVWGMSGDYVTAFFWGAGAKAVTDGAVGYLGINAALRSNLGQ